MENYKYKVTIGFPVYNVEKYVYHSLSSVLNQDFDDFEVIIVDDCGYDHSMDVIQELILTHPKKKHVRIIKHKQNEGLAEARNTIIKNANSKYIYFVDSDDYISKDALSILFKAAERYHTDVVYGSSFKHEGERIYEEDDNRLPLMYFLNPGDYTSYLYNNIRDVIPVVAWNALFSMDFLHKNNLLFPNIRYQEDLAFDELFQPFVQKAVLLPNKTYYYVMRADSLMNKQFRDKISINEVTRTINLCNILKETCQNSKNKVFYSGKCAKTMKKCFFQVAGIIKHRHQFTETLSNREIRDIMKHPESLFFILTHKQLRKYNLLYYIIGVLPPNLSISLIKIICKKKGYIQN